MSMQLTRDQDAGKLAVEFGGRTNPGNIGPPLPPVIVVKTFDRVTQLRSCALQVTKSGFGLLIQTCTLHDENGNRIFICGFGPVLIGLATIPTDIVTVPEQVRVPFFTPNLLLSSSAAWFAQPGWTMHINNAGAIATSQLRGTAYFDIY